MRVTLNTSEKYLLKNHYFTITATAEGGNTVTTNTLELGVKCGPDSNTFTSPGITHH